MLGLHRKVWPTNTLEHFMTLGHVLFDERSTMVTFWFHGDVLEDFQVFKTWGVLGEYFFEIRAEAKLDQSLEDGPWNSDCFVKWWINWGVDLIQNWRNKKSDLHIDEYRQMFFFLNSCGLAAVRRRLTCFSDRPKLPSISSVIGAMPYGRRGMALFPLRFLLGGSSP